MIEALADLRNRVFAATWFQDGVTRIPVLRGIAERRANQLFDLTAGFVYSQILLACVELDLFRRLAAGPQPTAELASEVQLSEDAFDRLVRAGSAIGLLQPRSHGLVALGPQGAALLGNPSVFSMIEHHRVLYRDLADPVALLRAPKGDSQLAAFWGYASAPDAGSLPREKTEKYSKLMASTQAFIAKEIVAAYAFKRHRHILDVGGGAGRFLAAVAAAAPAAKLTVFDLPTVAEQARTFFTEQGLEARASAVGGDFRKDELPRGADLVTLVRVLHDHDSAIAERLLLMAYDALPQGGRVLVAEPMAGTKGSPAMGDAYFGFYLWAMGTGQPRRLATLKTMMRAAGFTRVRALPTRRPMLAQLLIGTK